MLIFSFILHLKQSAIQQSKSQTAAIVFQFVLAVSWDLKGTTGTVNMCLTSSNGLPINSDCFSSFSR